MVSAQPDAETDVNAPRISDGPAGSAVGSGNAPDASRDRACQSRHVLGMRVDGTNYRETAESITELVSAGGGGAVYVSTVHMVMEAFDDPEFQRIVNSAERVTPDGLCLSCGRFGCSASRRPGASTGRLCFRWSVTSRVSVGCQWGSTGVAPKVLDELVRRIWRRFPGLDVSFAFAPPFRVVSADEDQKVIDEHRSLRDEHPLRRSWAAPSRSVGSLNIEIHFLVSWWGYRCSLRLSRGKQGTGARVDARSRVSSGCSGSAANRGACGVDTSITTPGFSFTSFGNWSGASR